jgi:hypothetical protein
MIPANLSGREVQYMTSTSTGTKIPTIVSRGMVFTPWEASPEDLKLLQNGHFLWLVQRGDSIPDMHMVVGPYDQVVPTDMRLEAIRSVAPETVEFSVKIRKENERIKSLTSAVYYSLWCLLWLGGVGIGVCLWLIARRLLWS